MLTLINIWYTLVIFKYFYIPMWQTWTNLQLNEQPRVGIEVCFTCLGESSCVILIMYTAVEFPHWFLLSFTMPCLSLPLFLKIPFNTVERLSNAPTNPVLMVQSDHSASPKITEKRTDFQTSHAIRRNSSSPKLQGVLWSVGAIEALIW